MGESHLTRIRSAVSGWEPAAFLGSPVPRFLFLHAGAPWGGSSSLASQAVSPPPATTDPASSQPLAPPRVVLAQETSISALGKIQIPSLAKVIVCMNACGLLAPGKDLFTNPVFFLRSERPFLGSKIFGNVEAQVGRGGEN